MNYTLEQLANIIGATVNGDHNHTVNSLSTLENATSTQVAFLSNAKYRQQLSNTNAGVVILNPAVLVDCKTNALVMDDPYLGYAQVAQLLDTTPASAQGIHSSAVIAEEVVIGNNVAIGANAVVEAGVSLADNVSIGAGCFIGKNTQIGKNTKLWANVSIYHQVIVGRDCLIQANTVIGSDGFGYAPALKDPNQFWHKIPQLGSVVIGNNVEIGASTTIDRGALDNTEIHDGVILDNQIQIAHNVIVGKNTAMAACSVIAGSSVIGKHCIIAGLVGINGHINVADGCTFTGMAMVTKSLKESGVYSSGMPVALNKEWNKTNARVKKLDSVFARVKTLEKQLAALENQLKLKE
ncbi:MAG: UDP-3-O-(3-hydroxymyristoyl)glucosamine N-acyltransferase [Gammaproteobacteria bacterium]|nr:MAG: UDP-3-O-(3-hydroxymyristoyl)glucosamine N-acyltransferase [Gammaproteobacteria bacterium]